MGRRAPLALEGWAIATSWQAQRNVPIDMNCLMAGVLAVTVPLLPRKALIQFDDSVPF